MAWKFYQSLQFSCTKTAKFGCFSQLVHRHSPKWCNQMMHKQNSSRCLAAFEWEAVDCGFTHLTTKISLLSSKITAKRYWYEAYQSYSTTPKCLVIKNCLSGAKKAKCIWLFILLWNEWNQSISFSCSKIEAVLKCMHSPLAAKDLTCSNEWNALKSNHKCLIVHNMWFYLKVLKHNQAANPNTEEQLLLTSHYEISHWFCIKPCSLPLTKLGLLISSSFVY